MQKKLSVLISILILSISLFSQDIKPCATPDVDLTSWIETMKANNAYPDFSRKLQTRDVIYIPIHYHIVTKSDGSQGYPLYYVLKMHCDLNKNYANSNVGIQFYIDSITYVNSDTYFEISSTVEDYLLSRAYNSPDACNVYIVNDPNGACGYTRRPQLNTSARNRTSIFLKGSYNEYKCTEPGSTTLSHEMGHWLDLPHTFNGWEGRTYGTSNALSQTYRERVVRTGSQANCRDRGDGFCDTDPDYNSQRWSCPSGRLYEDPLGTSFSLNPENYMCYASDECTSKFSDEQIVQMNNAMTKYAERRDLLELDPPNLDPLDEFTYYYPKATGPDEYVILDNSITFNFSKIENAEKYLFTLAMGNIALDNNFEIKPANIILDTFITDTSITISKDLVNTNVYFYWTLTPMSEDYTCSSNGLGIIPIKFDEFDINTEVINPTCAGFDDGILSIQDNSNLTNNLYSIDSADFTTETELEFLTAGNKILYIKTASNKLYTKEIYIEDGIQVDGNVSVVGNKVSVKNVKGKSPFVYEWSNGEKGSPIELDEGEYVLTITDDNGCVSDPIDVKVSKAIDSFASISNISNKEIIAYPTIIKRGEKMTISNLSVQTNYTLEIVDMTGRVLSTSQVQNTSEVSLDWNIEQSGIYFVRIISETDNTTIKIKAI